MNKPLCVLTFHRRGQTFWLKNKDFTGLTKTDKEILHIAALFSNGSAVKQIHIESTSYEK